TKKQLKFLPLFLVIIFVLSWQVHDIRQFLLLIPEWFQRNNWNQISNYLSVYLRPLLTEVFPWYWGVFDWLGVVMPIGIIRILNRVMILAGVLMVFKPLPFIMGNFMPA
ncbi:MAG: hypothetical protein UU17_C0041G0001, partial [Candidatus Nomurabacteria bacterium GW2011_GWA1_40_8]